MKRLLSLIRRNKLYTVLTVFIIAVNLAAFIENAAVKGEKALETARPGVRETQNAGEGKTLLELSEKDRQSRISSLAEENPKLYLFIGIFNLLILFMIFAGFFVDVYLAGRYFKKKPLRITINDRDPPRWGMPDVIRVVIIFLSLGYLFVVAQVFFLELFPILNNENFRMVFSTTFMNLVAISVIWFFVVKKHGQRVRDIGISARNAPAGVFYALAGYIALMPVILVILVTTYYVTELLRYKPPVQPIVEIFLEEKQTGVLWMSTIFAAVFGPVAEEIFFRGFMYPAVKKSLGAFWAILITAAVFSFLHAHIVGFMPILALGVLLAYLYEKTGSLIPPITVHILHNLGMVILVFIMRSLG